jgi:hypothetical protein
MENLELHTQVINLGKLFVNELKLDPGVDTFSKWMAHYVAEKMILTEQLAPGKDKDEAEKECFETILDLWKHRWLLPSGKRPLENFEPIFRILERLNPENADPFFYRFSNQEFLEMEKGSLDSKELNGYINTALQIDTIARNLINYILQQAVLKTKNENTKIMLKNAVSLSDNDDIKVIKYILDSDSSFDSENYKQEEFDKTYQIEKLNKRINELEKFAKLNALVLNSYKKELTDYER